MDLLLAKIWYFFYFGGMVCVWPYLNLFYRSHGLNDAQIGILAAIKPWVSASASFMWSGAADRYSAHRIIMLATFVISTLTRTSVALCSTFAAFMVLAVTGEFLAAPVGVMADAAVVAACKDDADYGKSRLWGTIAWGTLSAFSGGMVSQYGMNSGFAAYLLLSIPCVVCAWKMKFTLGANKQQQQGQGEEDKEEPEQNTAVQSITQTRDISRQAFAAGNLLEQQKQQLCQVNGQQQRTAAATADTANLRSGDVEQQHLLDQQQLLPEAGTADDSGPSSTPKQVGVCIVVHDEAVSLKETDLKLEQQVLRHQHRHRNNSGSETAMRQQQQQQQDFWLGLRQLLSSPAVLIFMWQATVMGFGIGVVGEFLFLFLQDLGGTETLMGLTLTVTCVAEVPAFHFQPQLLKVVTVHTMLHIVMWAYIVRLGLYALLPVTGTAWAVLPVELLHGVCFGCGWSAGTITSKRVAPQGLEATMQGIFQGLYFGLGQGLGALIGGLLKNRFNGQIMFALCSGICLSGWAACVVAEHLTGTAHATDNDDRMLQLDCKSCATTAAAAAAGRDGAGAHGFHGPQQLQQLQGPVGNHQLVSRSFQRVFAPVARLVGRLHPYGSRFTATGLTTSDGDECSNFEMVSRRKYSELASKDSGPDLSTGVVDVTTVGDRRLRS